VRWKTEMSQVQERWGVIPPLGLDYAGIATFLYEFEQDYPNYKAERDAIRKRYGRTLRTEGMEEFCGAYGVYLYSVY